MTDQDCVDSELVAVPEPWLRLVARYPATDGTLPEQIEAAWAREPELTDVIGVVHALAQVPARRFDAYTPGLAALGDLVVEHQGRERVMRAARGAPPVRPASPASD